MEKYRVTCAPSFKKEVNNYFPIAKGRKMTRPTSISNSSLGSSISSDDFDSKTQKLDNKIHRKLTNISRSSLSSFKSALSNDSGASFKSISSHDSGTSFNSDSSEKSGSSNYSEELNSRSAALQLVFISLHSFT